MRLLLVDECVPKEISDFILGTYDAVSIHSLQKQGLKDPEVYALALEMNRLVLTFNIGDFFKLFDQNPSKLTGIIGLKFKVQTLITVKPRVVRLFEYTPLLRLYGSKCRVSPENIKVNDLWLNV